MSDIKEVIRVLGFIQEYFDNHADEQEPNKRKELFVDWSDTVLEAITLLKAQEPRVMTLEEVKSMKRYTICAVEQRSKLKLNVFNAEYRGCFAIGQRHMLDFGLYMDVNPFRRSEGGYGKTWRCWTSRPTDVQREATAWND